MSHQVVIDYQGVSVEAQAKCDVAVASLCKIGKTLNRIHETASSLETSKVKEYEAYLLEAKEKIKTKIEAFKKSLDAYKQRSKKVDSDSKEYNQYLQTKDDIIAKADELLNLTNQLTGSKLAVIDQMIDEGLLDAGNRLFENLGKKANDVLNLDEKMMDKINSIEDVSLRDLTYRELLNEENKGLSFEQLKAKAQEEYDILLGKKTATVIAETKEELKQQGIDTEVLNNAKTISEATSIANDAIVDEKIRKETLKVIIKSIKARGFIVDTKNNLKIDKKNNIVKLVALKASGQRAEFEIQLNGKFMYHFDQYEGQACKKDIEPFLEDLKNIYDIDIKHEEVIWENPDKVQTQKYQYVNKNKGTN